MTLKDLMKLPLLQTATIADICARDEKTTIYILECLKRFYSGDYGEICEEDTAANNSDLEAGFGHVLARYKKAEGLKGDIYIESHFDRDNLENVDYSQTVIMYPNER